METAWISATVQDMSVDYPGSTPATEAPTRVATLAAHDLVARRIEALLAAGGMTIAPRWAAATDAPAGPEPVPDVLVMVFGHGVTARDQQMRRLSRRLPAVRILAVMPQDSRRGIRRAVESGADGVVFEPDLDRALVPTVRAIVAGQIAVPHARGREVDRPTLSAREKQVLGLVVAGKSNKAIAGELFLAESTVKCHLSSAFSKLGVRSRNEAADLVIQSGNELGFPLLVVPASHATTEGSAQMTTVVQNIEGDRA